MSVKFQLPALFIRVPERHTTSIREVADILERKDFGEIADVWFHFTKSGKQFAVVYFKRWFYRSEDMLNDLRRNGRIFICTKYGDWETSVYNGNERPRPPPAPAAAARAQTPPRARRESAPQTPPTKPAPKTPNAPQKMRPQTPPYPPTRRGPQTPPRRMSAAAAISEPQTPPVKPSPKTPNAPRKARRAVVVNQDVPLAPCLPEKKKRHHPPRKGSKPAQAQVEAQVEVEEGEVVDATYEDPFGEEFSPAEYAQYEYNMYSHAMAMFTPFYVEQILCGTLQDGPNQEYKEYHDFLREMFPVYLPWIITIPEMWCFLGYQDTPEDVQFIDAYNYAGEVEPVVESVAEEVEPVAQEVEPVVEPVATAEEPEEGMEYDEMYADVL